MKKQTLLELLYAKNFKMTLRYMRLYEAYMRNGISYDQLYNIMEHDYKVYLEKQKQKEEIDITSENAILRLNELDNISTNITSDEDAICKFKALSLANENLNED